MLDLNKVVNHQFRLAARFLKAVTIGRPNYFELPARKML